MNKHLAMRSGNPALSSSTFKNLHHSVSGSSMTIQGTVHKQDCSCFSIISAGYVWVILPCIVAMPAEYSFILAMVTAFKPTISHITVPACNNQGIFGGYR